MLAAHFDDHDILGQWMGHHLAELVSAAQDNTGTTVEQRRQIIETILKIWSHRWNYPSPAPLKEFKSVVVALDRLGDDSPWRFSRIFGSQTDALQFGISGIPLITTAVELEHLTRETLLHLIWLTVNEANEKNKDWLEVAEKAASSLEGDLTTMLERLQRRAALDRTAATHNSAEDACDEEGLAETTVTKDIAWDDPDDEVTDPSEDDGDDAPDLLSNASHVKRLREMANLLNGIADSLSA